MMGTGGSRKKSPRIDEHITLLCDVITSNFTSVKFSPFCKKVASTTPSRFVSSGRPPFLSPHSKQHRGSLVPPAGTHYRIDIHPPLRQNDGAVRPSTAVCPPGGGPLTTLPSPRRGTTSCLSTRGKGPHEHACLKRVLNCVRSNRNRKKYTPFSPRGVS